MPFLTFSKGKFGKCDYFKSKKFCKVKIWRYIYHTHTHGKVKRHSFQQVGKIFATHNTRKKDTLLEVEQRNINNSKEKLAKYINRELIGGV